MLIIEEIVEAQDETAVATLTLSFNERQRSRLRAKLDSGEEVGIYLPRGNVMRGGDRLRCSDGRVVEVKAATEKVSTITAPSSVAFSRLAYHLGNRHVPLQIEKAWLRYTHDHVLDHMVCEMGGDVMVEEAPFEPEIGAYKGHGGHHHHHEHA